MLQKTTQIRQFIFLVLICSLGYVTVGQTQTNTSQVVLKGNISNIKTCEDITFRFYKDLLTYEELVYQATIQEDSFFLTFPIENYAAGFLEFKDFQIPVFLEEGDQLMITSDAKAFLDALQYSGKGELANNFLLKQNQIFYKKEQNIIRGNYAPRDFQKAINTHKKEKIDFLATYLAQRDTTFSFVFKKYMEADMDYWWGYQLFQFREVQLNKETTNKDFPANYFQFVHELKLNVEPALKNIHYLKYLTAYSNWLQEKNNKNTLSANKQLVSTKKVKTVGHILIDQLEVRKEAHNALSTFARLAKDSEVSYMQDKTNDRFIYMHKGLRFSDYFLKVKLADGQQGWVVSMGVQLNEKVNYVEKWVKKPENYAQIFNDPKYEPFKGKVKHYAICRDLYKGVLNKTHSIKALENYLEQAPNYAFAKTLKAISLKIKKKVAQLATVQQIPTKTKTQIINDANQILLAEFIQELAKTNIPSVKNEAITTIKKPSRTDKLNNKNKSTEARQINTTGKSTFTPTTSTVNVGVDAPIFSLKDIHGKSISLNNYRGKVIFLDFWATWCAPCVQQLPAHRKLQNQFKDKEVAFIYVSVDKQQEIWQQFIENRNFSGIHLNIGDPILNSSITEKYNVSSLPYTLLIDAEGKIVWHHTGGYSVQRLGQRIAELLQ